MNDSRVWNEVSCNAGDDYFGVCPTCFKFTGYINIGKGHWFFCKEHRVKWWFGSNIFSDWRQQTEEEQREAYDSLGFTDYDDLTHAEIAQSWRN
jgi:hypothetical protein